MYSSSSIPRYYIGKSTDIIFPGDNQLIADLLSNEKAIVIAYYPGMIPENYCVVHAPKTSQFEGLAFVAAPKTLSRNCQ